MAQINCPKCGNEISDTCITCPHCGFTPSKPSKNPFKSILPAGNNSPRDRAIINNPILLLCMAVIIIIAGMFVTSPKQSYPLDGLSFQQSREAVQKELGSPNYTSAADQAVQVDLYTKSAFLGKTGTLQVEYDSNGLLNYACWYYSAPKNMSDSVQKDLQAFSLSVVEELSEILGSPDGGDPSYTWHLEDGSTVTLTIDLAGEQPVLMQLNK